MLNIKMFIKLKTMDFLTEISTYSYIFLYRSTLSIKMPSPDNGVYIIIGEMNMVMTAMKKSSRWSSHIHQVCYISYMLLDNFSLSIYTYTHTYIQYGILK